ncbi:MAG TPA: TspO/MBR family protein [Candidatus Paceibacterota bacterium]
MTSKITLKLIGAIALCEFAGIIGSFFTIESIPTWYAGLLKPALNPPSWVFAPVWITLYFLMGIAFFFIWQSPIDAPNREKAILFFIVQLVLNAFWSIIFFGFHEIFWALADIAFLWFFILLTVIYFWKISKPASILLWPYFLWVSFASYLNFSLFLLN